MRPLTLYTPKPLLQVSGKPLIEHHIARLYAAGIREIVVNVSYLGEQIQAFLEKQLCVDVKIHISHEGEPLETAGGILHARQFLGDEPFVLVNADVWTDYPFQTLVNTPLQHGTLGRLVLVNNPEHNPSGDFQFSAVNKDIHQGGRCGLIQKKHPLAEPSYTYAGISLINPALIYDFPTSSKKLPLIEPFLAALAREQLDGELYEGVWMDIGTPERFEKLQHPF